MGYYSEENLVHTSDRGYKIYLDKCTLYVIAPENKRYATSYDSKSSRATHGVRALNLTMANNIFWFYRMDDIKQKHNDIRQKYIDITKSFLDHEDDLISDFMGVALHTTTFNTDEKVLSHILNSDFSNLTKFALIFSVSANMREYTPELIDEIVEVNGAAEDNPLFNLGTLVSYATPFYPSQITVSKKGVTPKSSNIADIIKYANSIAGIDDDKVFSNIYGKVTPEQIEHMQYIFGKRRNINESPDISQLDPALLGIVRLFGDDKSLIPRSMIRLIKEKNLSSNDQIPYEYSILDKSSYDELSTKNHFNSTVLLYVIIKHGEIDIAIQIDEHFRKNTHFTDFYTVEDKTLKIIDEYFDETDGDIPYDIWASINGHNYEDNSL